MPPITPAPADIPDEECESMSTAGENVSIHLSDSDSISDNDIVDHNGYELLSQDPENVYVYENEEEDFSSTCEMDESIASEADNLNSYSLCSNVDAAPSCISSEIPAMDEEHIETIKSVMKGITLPSTSLPQWANVVPEEEWKAVILSRMHATQTKSKSNNRGTHSKKLTNSSEFDMSSEMLR